MTRKTNATRLAVMFAVLIFAAARNHAQTILTNGLVAFYPFNGNAADASGRGHNGTIQGAVLTPDRFGITNAAFYFNGEADIDVPSAADFDWNPAQGMTISVWAFPTVFVSPENLVQRRNNNTSFWQLAIGPGALNGLPLDQWTHLVVTMSPSAQVYYTNGAFCQQYTSGVISGASTADVLIGGSVIYGGYVGDLDEVRIYNRILSTNEVQQLYAYESTETNPPQVTGQPVNLVVNAHDPASFSVTASGSPPLNYQWLFNGTNIPGATSNSFAITNVVQTNLGDYSVVVSNSFGSQSSSNATLSMYPFILVPFTGVVAYWGKDATLSVDAWGTGPLDYQWFDDGNAISGATNQTLLLAAIQATNAGLYSVVVTDPFGSVTNAGAQVVVEPAGVSLGFSPTLTISGVAGYTYIIQSAPNLTDSNAWVTVTNLTLTQPVQLWVDTNVDASSPFNPTRFYRVLAGQ